MQPTIKIRLKKVDSLYKCDPFLKNSYGEMFVFQQWWENDYAKSAPQYEGEWKDIPIEVEE